MNETNIIRKTSSFGEVYEYAKHKSGLDVYVIPKDFATYYAEFATRYGAMDNCFRLEGEEDFREVPDGIAHYLEHKMFENEDGVDTFARFAAYGAEANAYTMSTMTSYLFSCTDHFEKNLEILIDYVSKPYFTEENVEKERGIIAQELRMYEDDPASVVYYNLLRAMYEKNQVRIDEGGTVESIAKITPELLYDCYHTFYSSANMTLCISGRVTMNEVLEILDRTLPEKENPIIHRRYFEEGPAVFKTRATASFEIAKPIFLIGVKDMDIPEDPLVRMKKKIAMGILVEMLFGSTSDFAIDVYESGLVNGFAASFVHDAKRSMILLEGEADAPEEVYEHFLAYLCEKREKGLSEEDFSRVKRALYASFVKMYDSTRLAGDFTHMIHDGMDPFAYEDAVRGVTLADVQALFPKLFREEAFAMSVVNPIS